MEAIESMNTNITTKALAQGDVLLIPVAAIPASASRPFPRVDGKLVLAYGEVTGHAHHIDEPTTEGWLDENDQAFIAVRELIEEVKLLHGHLDGRPDKPEDKPHDPIAIPPGNYRVIRGQREFVSAKGVTRLSPD